MQKALKIILSQKTYLYYMNVCYWIYSSSIRPYSYNLSCEWEPKRDQIAIQRRVGIHEPTDGKKFQIESYNFAYSMSSIGSDITFSANGILTLGGPDTTVWWTKVLLGTIERAALDSILNFEVLKCFLPSTSSS